MYSVFCQNCTFPQPASAFTRGHTVNLEYFTRKGKIFLISSVQWLNIFLPSPKSEISLNAAYQSQRPGHYNILHIASLFYFKKIPPWCVWYLKLEIRDYSLINILASGCFKGLHNFVDNHCVIKQGLFSSIISNFYDSMPLQDFYWTHYQLFVKLLGYFVVLYQINAALTCLTRKLSPDPDPDSIDPTKNSDQATSTQ